MTLFEVHKPSCFACGGKETLSEESGCRFCGGMGENLFPNAIEQFGCASTATRKTRSSLRLVSS